MANCHGTLEAVDCHIHSVRYDMAVNRGACGRLRWPDLSHSPIRLLVCHSKQKKPLKQQGAADRLLSAGRARAVAPQPQFCLLDFPQISESRALKPLLHAYYNNDYHYSKFFKMDTGLFLVILKGNAFCWSVLVSYPYITQQPVESKQAKRGDRGLDWTLFTLLSLILSRNSAISAREHQKNSNATTEKHSIEYLHAFNVAAYPPTARENQTSKDDN
eukprot:scaffold4649_cov117-Skeletonema_dohrnii-CCMP3373.AAC.2